MSPDYRAGEPIDRGVRFCVKKRKNDFAADKAVKDLEVQMEMRTSTPLRLGCYRLTEIRGHELRRSA